MIFTQQSFREKIVLTTSAVFPARDITYLHLRVSQTTNHSGASSTAACNISIEYHQVEGESRK